MCCPSSRATSPPTSTLYLPKETISAELQSDYFFGKPVAGAKVKVTASTFDVAFKDFQTVDTTTDAQGHAKFEIRLPDSFVGQPLQKGDALVKLEVKITDTADHTETITKTYPVSDQPIRVSLLPEGGRITPGLENRVFAAATYPDGSPAQCDVKLWIGKEAKDKPYETLKTGESGLAEFRVTPKADQIRADGQGGMHNIEMLGGQQQQVWGQQNVFDLYAEASDAKGATAKAAVTLNTEPLGENVLLRLDKAVYKPGEAVQLDVRSSAGLPTAYVDVVRSGQTVLTKWLDVKDGKAEYALDLPQSLFGTLEVHAYQMLGSGEIIRDARVVYVQPADGLKIDVHADRDDLPAGRARARSRLPRSPTRRAKPAAAAAGRAGGGRGGVRPAGHAARSGEGLLHAAGRIAQAAGPGALQATSEGLDSLVRAPELSAGRQQVAEAALADGEVLRPKPPARWDVNPVAERRQKIEGQAAQIGWAVWNYAQSKQVLVQDKASKAWSFKPELLKELADQKQIDPSLLNDPVGGKLTLDALAKIEKDFTATDKLGAAVTHQRIWQLRWSVVNYTNGKAKEFMKDGKWVLPEAVLSDAAKQQGLGGDWLKDAWGQPLKLVKLDKKRTDPQGQTQFEEYDIVSAGPDGKVGTDDDVKLSADPVNPWRFAQLLVGGGLTREDELARAAVSGPNSAQRAT